MSRSFTIVKQPAIRPRSGYRTMRLSTGRINRWSSSYSRVRSGLHLPGGGVLMRIFQAWRRNSGLPPFHDPVRHQ